MNTAFYNELAPLLKAHQATLIAVTKNQPLSALQELYDFGLRRFGENRVQELCEKQQQLPADIEWHLIGHLQSNKVKYIAPFISYIHSVDSLKLLEEINKHAAANNRIIKCMLQCYIASEETKYGLDKQELIDILNAPNFKTLQHIEIVGLMGMATNTSDTKLIAQEFKHLKNIFNQIQSQFFSTQKSFKELSMGMSSDYQIALACGSTMLRIGSMLFNP